MIGFPQMNRVWQSMARHVIGIMLVILCNSMRVMADPPGNAGEGMSLGEPFWRSQAMDNEPVLNAVRLSEFHLFSSVFRLRCPPRLDERWVLLWSTPEDA